jgi:hypothetical protein
MSIYDGIGFSYSLKSSDSTNIDPEQADILDARDRQLTDFTSTLKVQTSVALVSKLNADDVRFGTQVLTLPAIGGAITVTFDNPFPGGTNVYVVVSNGDYAANSADLEAGVADSYGFDVYRVSGGVTGNLFRVNYVAFIA